MRFKYSFKNIDYVVESTTDTLPDRGEVEVLFLARIGGGRGRMPKTKEVPVDDLEALIDFTAAKKLLQR